MKAVLILGILALLMITPGATAEELPFCEGQGTKTCVLETAGAVFGPCHPLYNYVKECDPTS